MINRLITPGDSYDTAVGVLSLGQMVDGTGNIAIGNESGYDNYSGDDNIYIGNQGRNTDTDIIHIGTQEPRRRLIWRAPSMPTAWR